MSLFQIIASGLPKKHEIFAANIILPSRNRPSLGILLDPTMRFSVRRLKCNQSKFRQFWEKPEVEPCRWLLTSLRNDMAMTQSDKVEVKRIRGKGRGVFARRSIVKGEVFETCPVLILPAGSLGNDASGLGSYVFEWGKGTLALAMGYGSLYNHSYRPNARYDDVRQGKAFSALRDIELGEEITVNYNGDPGDSTEVWFEVVEELGLTR